MGRHVGVGAGTYRPESTHADSGSIRQLAYCFRPWAFLAAPQSLAPSVSALRSWELPVSMAAAVTGILLGGLPPRAAWLPTLQTVRHGSKAVTRHPRVMHFERQKLMAITEYIPPKPAIHPRCLPPPPNPPKEESGLIQLLRRDIAAVFRDHRMIAVCQNVAMSTEDKLLLQHQLRKHRILIKVFPNQVLKPFLEDSKYQNLLPLFVGHNLLLISEEPKVKEMVRILKSVPFLPLLGGCIDDTILSRQGFVDYAKLPSLDVLRRELVGGLTCLVAQTCSLLQHQPAQLTSLLNQYVKQQPEDESATPASGKPPPPDPAPEP